MLKKIISIMLTVLMLLSCSSMALAWTGLSDADDPNIVRIGVISDTHQSFDGLKKALDTYYTLDSSLDGFIFAGDIIYMKDKVDPSLYDTLLATEVGGPEKKTIGTLLKEGKISYAMGNHETPLHSDAETMAESAEEFTEKTGQNPNAFKTFGDYCRVISISPDDYSGYFTNETADFLEAEVDKALEDTKGPVFINTHFGFHKTVVSTDTLGFNCAKFPDGKLSIIEEIKSNPRVIVISGHVHASERDPRAIYQEKDGFTAVQTSVVSGGSAPFSEGLLLEINKATNNVKVRRVDFTQGIEIGEPWEINTNGTDQLYTDAARKAKAKAPEFPENAAVTAEPFETTATITVTAATKFEESETNYAHYYDVKYTNYDTGVSQIKTFDSDYYNAEQKETLEFKLDGLTAGTEYVVEITARSPLGISSEPVTSEVFKTNTPEFEDITLEDIVTKDVSLRSNTSIASGSIYTNKDKITQTCGISSTNWIEFEFNIETAGYYRISTQLGADDTPTAKLFVDNVEKASRTISQGSWNYFEQTMIWADVYLEAGTRTMRFQHTGGSGSIRFYTMSVGKIPDDKIDPVKLGYSVTQTVAEALEYNPNYWKDEYTVTTDTKIVEGKTYYTLSGTTYTAVASPDVANIANYYVKTRNKGQCGQHNHLTAADPYFNVSKAPAANVTFKFTPEFSGVYDLSLREGTYGTGVTLDTQVTVTETITGKKNSSGSEVTDTGTHTVGTFVLNGITDNAKIWRRYGALALEAGTEYTIVLDNTRTDSNYLALCGAKLTCINFDPSVHNLVTTTYAGEATENNVETTSKYGIGTDDNTSGWITKNIYMKFDVFVPVDAKYDIFLKGGSNSDISVHYTIQGQSFVETFENTITDTITNGFSKNNKIERLMTEGVNLKKGHYTVYLYIKSTSSDALNLRAFTLKTSGAYSSDNTVLEYIDCDAKTISSSSSHIHDHGAFLTATNHFLQWNNKYFTAGTYMVYLNYGVYDESTNVSAVLTLDGRAVATTKLIPNGVYTTGNNGTSPIDLSNNYFNGYVATVRLDEGIHTIKLGTTGSNYSVSGMKFVPIKTPNVELFNDNTVNLDARVTEIQNGAITLRAGLPKTDLGKTMNVIFAIYETSNVEGSLPELYKCAIKEVTIDNNYRAILTIPNISMAEGKTYSYKVFYWDTLDNVKPLY